MASYKSLVGSLCLLSLLSPTINAAPVPEAAGAMKEATLEVVERAANSYTNPNQLVVSIAGWPNIAEEDCYVALCLLGGERVYQRQLTQAAGQQAYTASGSALQPFQEQNLSRYGTQQINANTISPEEFPWRSLQATNRYVMPATRAEQYQASGSQGTSISHAYSNTNGIAGNQGAALGEWVRITFTGAPLGPSCTALHADPQDFSVCTNHAREAFFGSTNVDISQYTFLGNGNSFIKPGSSSSKRFEDNELE